MLFIGKLPGLVVWRPYRQDTIGTSASSDSALSKKYETLRIPCGGGRHLTADNFPSCPSCTTARLESKQLQTQFHPIVERPRDGTSGAKATDCLGDLVMSLVTAEFRRSAQEPDLQVVRTEFRLMILSVFQ